MSNANPTKSAGDLVAKVQQRFFRQRALDRTPLILTHKRIYIVPSKRGWMFAASLAIMLIASMNYAINLGFALCFLLTGLFASSLLATYLNLDGLTIDACDEPHGFCGDSLLYRLKFLTSEGHTRHGIKIQTKTHSPDIINIPAAGEASAELRLQTAKRGLKALGRVTLSSDYPLGLWRTWSYFHVSCNGLVYPKAEKHPPPFPSGPNNSGATTELIPDGDEEFNGLKQYQPGDPLSRVAWKTAAKGQGWYSKQFSEFSGCIKFQFSLQDTNNLNDLELRLSRLTAWVLKAHHEGAEYSLSLPGYNSSLDSGNNHRHKLLAALALFELHDNDH